MSMEFAIPHRRILKGDAINQPNPPPALPHPVLHAGVAAVGNGAPWTAGIFTAFLMVIAAGGTAYLWKNYHRSVAQPVTAPDYVTPRIIDNSEPIAMGTATPFAILPGNAIQWRGPVAIATSAGIDCVVTEAGANCMNHGTGVSWVEVSHPVEK